MKIAITSLYLPSGSKIGVGYQVHGLANALATRGHAVTVFSPCLLPVGAHYDVQTVPVGRRLRTFGFAWNLRGIDFDSFDVLNAHGDDWFLWGVRRPRHIHTFHGSCLAEMRNIRGGKEKARMGLLALCETQAAFLADENVAVSENTRRFVPGIDHVIPCGVALSTFAPKGDKPDRPAILFVGTMHGRKRGRWLVETFVREVRPRLPEAELWCVCEHPTDLGPQPGVRWLGRLSEEELADWYRRAWVFCLPSTYEGFGVPYIEAMASGTAVVATPNPGAVEITSGGRFGVLASDEEMGQKLCALLANEDLRHHYEILGLTRAQDFSWAKVCARYERLYQNAEPVESAA